MDPGFLERGFICIKVCGGWWFRFADFISFFLKNPMKMKRPNIYFILKNHRILKNGGQDEGSSEPSEPLDPPL